MSKLEHLKGKKILFFCVQTFNLEKDLIRQFEKYGAKVTYFDERPSNSILTKGIIRINRRLMKKKIHAYYKEILIRIKDEDFDYLLVNRGEVLPREFLESFIQIQPKCKRMFYTWDSFENHSNALTILDLFNQRFTFDKQDAKNYKIGFRPLYFTDRYREVLKCSNIKTIDLLFLGTAHSDRYVISSKIASWCYKNDLNIYNYYYMQSRLVYFYKVIFDSSFKNFDIRKLSFKSLSIDQIINLYKKSDVILDISHPGQSGLTMRTFESIGSGKKLVTTNKNIKDYPFFNPKNILIIDRKSIRLSKDFFSGKYESLTPELYERCSIDGWISDIFFGKESNYWTD